MGRLRQSEIAAFSAALGVLYSTADLPSLATRVTSCLHALFSCELTSFDLFDESATRWSALVVSPTIPKWEEAVAVLQHHAHEHPIVGHAARAGHAHAVRTSDLTLHARVPADGTVPGFFRVHVMKTNCQLGFVARPSPTLTVGASANRRRRDFSAEERVLMEQLRPHLLQAYLLAQATAGSSELLASQRETSARLAAGQMCETDADGRIVWQTAGLDALLTRFFDPERTAPGGLPRSVLRPLKEAQRAGRAASEGRLSRPRAWKFARGGEELSVRIAAQPVGNCWQLLFSEHARGRPAELLAAQHGLSKRESEVLTWMSHGKTNPEIAMILGVATRTVEKHVERLFAKLKVYNRVAATRLVLAGTAEPTGV